jgi:hypothetical protein
MATRQEEEERTRRRLLAVEAAALLLLRRRPLELVRRRAEQEILRQALAESVLTARQLARIAGTDRLIHELRAKGVGDLALESTGDAMRDVARARRISDRFARDVVRRAEARGTDAGLRLAEQRLRLIGVSESAEAFSHERDRIIRETQRAGTRVRLYKAWDATLDKHTCEVCERAHGSVVPIDEEFPEGRPGGVHPFCRCVETILREDEIVDFQRAA